MTWLYVYLSLGTVEVEECPCASPMFLDHEREMREMVAELGAAQQRIVELESQFDECSELLTGAQRAERAFAEAQQPTNFAAKKPFFVSSTSTQSVSPSPSSSHSHRALESGHCR